MLASRLEAASQFELDRDDADIVQGREQHYVLDEVRGRGGFSTTYRARASGSEERVLVKELRLDRADSWKAVELFEREGNALSRLNHPGIPRWIEHFTTTRDETGDSHVRLFLVMEFVEGANLAEHIATHGPMSAVEATALLRELLGILAYLADQTPPVIHRDITPKNIVLGARDKLPRLVDFGAVQNILRPEGASGSTMIGTPGYMPMEQVMGQARPATDLFSLGMSIVFALSGKSPTEFRFDDAGGRMMLRPLAERIPPYLFAVLEKMVEPTLGARFSSAKLVLEGLDEGLRAATVEARRVWAEPRSASQNLGRRNRAVEGNRAVEDRVAKIFFTFFFGIPMLFLWVVTVEWPPLSQSVQLASIPESRQERPLDYPRSKNDPPTSAASDKGALTQDPLNDVMVHQIHYINEIEDVVNANASLLRSKCGDLDSQNFAVDITIAASGAVESVHALGVRPSLKTCLESNIRTLHFAADSSPRARRVPFVAGHNNAGNRSGVIVGL
jgi:serine/threonine protein kinase